MGTEGEGYVSDDASDGPDIVLDGDRSLMLYMGDNSAATYTLNNYDFTETGTQLRFLASSKRPEYLSEMKVYIYHEWPAYWVEILMNNTFGIYAFGGQLFGLGGNPPTHPREMGVLGAFQYGDTYAFTVDFDFVAHTYTVAAENLTDPGQVLTPQTLYLAEDYEEFPVTLEHAKNSTLQLRSVNAGQGLGRDMWDNVAFVPSATETVAAPVFDPDPAPGTYYETAQNVTITSSTPGASIYYTTDGSTPSESSTPYTVPISVSTATTIKARAYATGYLPSDIVTERYIFAGLLYFDFEEPEFSYGPVSGQQGWTSVNPDDPYVTDNWSDGDGLVLAGEQSLMFYMGSNEPAEYTLNNFGFTETDTQLRFLASSKRPEFLSNMIVYLYHEWPAVWAQIHMSNAFGIYAFSGQLVGLGGNPPTHPREMKVLGAFQYGDVYSFTVDFDFVAHTYTVAAENLTDPGQVLTPQTCYLCENNENYPVTLEHAQNSTLQMKSQQSGGGGLVRDMYDNVFFGLNDTEFVEAPVFTPGAGNYATAQNVTITCGTPGASIYYTTDGWSIPTESSTPYTGPISVSSSTTIKAKAFADGAIPSDVVTAAYVIPLDYERPKMVYYSDSIDVNGDLSDWAGAEWAPLDQNYYLDPSTDIAEAYYAAKWGDNGNKVYIAVKVRDTFHKFTNVYTDWDERDAVELYIHTTGTGPIDYSSTQADAQQYTIGFNIAETGLWSSVGYNPPNGNPTPAGAFEAFGSIDGEWLYYEAALTPYHYFRLDGSGLQVSTLSSGQVIGLDVVAACHDAVEFVGMKSENTKSGKSSNYNSIGLHLLVSISNIAEVKTAPDGASVDISAIVSAAFSDYFYIEAADRSYGIRVAKASHGLAAGQEVTVGGSAETLASGERYIQAAAVSVSGAGTIDPLEMNNKSLGGSDFGTAPDYQVGVDGGNGLNNIGLFVRTTGEVGATGSGWFMVDDGSEVSVKVLGTLPGGATYVAVTGASSCENDGGVVKRVIESTSIQVIQP